MKNKILKTFLFFVLFSTLLITASFAVEIKEDASKYKSSAFIIGSTRFDSQQIITADKLFDAGINEKDLYDALGKDIKKADKTLYYYVSEKVGWLKVAEETLPLTENETKKLEENLNIFFVNNEVKTLEVKYTGDVNKDSISNNVKYDEEKGVFIVPAITFNFTFEDSKGVETKVNTNVDTNLKIENGEEHEEAEIKRNPEVKFELAKEIVAGEATEFTVSTVANDYVGTMVVGTGSVKPDNVLKLEYAVGDQWVEMTGESIFGNEGAGFPLQDATSKFRVTFDKAGEYDVTFAIKNLETGKIMADVATKTNVTTTKNVSNQEDLEKALSNESVTDIKLLKDIDLPKAAVVSTKVTLDLNGKTLTAKTDTVGDGIFKVITGGDLTINGEGTIDSACQTNDYSMAIWATGTGKVTINGGTYTNKGAKSVEDNGTTPNNNELIYGSVNAQIVINGGTFIGNTDNEEYGAKFTLNLKDKNNDTSSIVVKGGTFTEYNPANSASENPRMNFLADGYKVVLKDNKYTVVKVEETDAILGDGMAYDNLQTAVNSASKVKLLKSIDLPTAVEVTTKVTLDLNGKTLTAKNDTEGNGIFWVKTAGDLTINGEGTIDSACQTNDYSMAIWASGKGKVTINGGTYTNVGAKSVENQDKDGDGELDPNNNELIYASADGQIVINGGTFIGNTENKKWGTRYTLNLKDKSNATITVKGGIFTGYDPANSKSENPTKNLVAEGYESNGVDGIYTVVKKAN